MSVSLQDIGVPAPMRTVPADSPALATDVATGAPSRSKRRQVDPAAIPCNCSHAPWDAATASIDDLLERAQALVFAHRVKSTATAGRNGLEAALKALQDHPGNTWQERWNASPAGNEPGWVIQQVQARGRSRHAALSGQLALLVLGVIRPSYWWLNQQDFQGTYALVRQVRDSAGADRVLRTAEEMGIAAQGQEQIARVLSQVLVHTGKQVAEITAADLLEIDAYVQMTNDRRNQANRLWDVLHRLGQIDGLATLRHARNAGQRSAAELVDSYGVQSSDVRDVLVRYLRRRQPGLDYKSFTTLVRDLVLNFWRQIEDLNPALRGSW